MTNGASDRFGGQLSPGHFSLSAIMAMFVVLGRQSGTPADRTVVMGPASRSTRPHRIPVRFGSCHRAVDAGSWGRRNLVGIVSYQHSSRPVPACSVPSEGNRIFYVDSPNLCRDAIDKRRCRLESDVMSAALNSWRRLH